VADDDNVMEHGFECGQCSRVAAFRFPKNKQPPRRVYAEPGLQPLADKDRRGAAGNTKLA
jgi:hypothetical protein